MVLYDKCKKKTLGWIFSAVGSLSEYETHKRRPSLLAKSFLCFARLPYARKKFFVGFHLPEKERDIYRYTTGFNDPGAIQYPLKRVSKWYPDH